MVMFVFGADAVGWWLDPFPVFGSSCRGGFSLGEPVEAFLRAGRGEPFQVEGKAIYPGGAVFPCRLRGQPGRPSAIEADQTDFPPWALTRVATTTPAVMVSDSHRPARGVTVVDRPPSIVPAAARWSRISPLISRVGSWRRSPALGPRERGSTTRPRSPRAVRPRSRTPGPAESPSPRPVQGRHRSATRHCARRRRWRVRRGGAGTGGRRWRRRAATPGPPAMTDGGGRWCTGIPRT